MTQTTTPTPLRDRVAGAPISWGVCEVPGWGHQLGLDLVLEQMREVGLAATEFGPDGFLPDAPEAKAHTLAAAGLRAVGQFVPVVLHDAAVDPLPDVVLAMEALTAARASTVVIAAATGEQGYDERPVLDDAQWATLLGNLDRIFGRRRRARLARDAAPPRRHHGRDGRGDRPGAGRQPHRALPRHRPPAHRRR